MNSLKNEKSRQKAAHLFENWYPVGEGSTKNYNPLFSLFSGDLRSKTGYKYRVQMVSDMRRDKVPNLHQQYNTYFFRRVIPEDVREHFGGRSEYKVSLKTTDLRTAKMRIGIQRELLDAKIALHRGEPGRLMDLAKAYRKRSEEIRKEHPEPDDPRRYDKADDLFDDAIVQFIDTQIPGGWNSVLENDPVNPSKIDAIRRTPGGEDIHQFVNASFGSDMPTDFLIEEWLPSYDVADKTNRMAESEVRTFARAFPRLSTITKGEVGKWLQRRQQKDGLATATIRRNLSHIRAYARFLEDRDLLRDTEAIFRFRTTGRQNRRDKGSKSWAAWTPEEAVHLWRSADNTALQDVIWLGMWTGARLDEICSWTGADIIDGDFINNLSGKTDAAIRKIPIHPALQPRIDELIKINGGGRLIPSRAANPSSAMSKRFKRLTVELGYDNQRKVFHSFRKTVVTQLQNARVQTDMIHYLIAHKQEFTFDVYSSGLENRQAMHEAISVLTYPL